MYLVLFSAAFFFKGPTGLTITVGAILTLFVLMQVTAKVNWKQVFEQKQRALTRVSAYHRPGQVAWAVFFTRRNSCC